MTAPRDAATATPDNGNGRLLAANVSLRRELEDLRAEVEQVRSQREQALRGIEEKSQLMAHMSHELRTPMNGILGMTQLALQTQLDPQQREYLEVARSSADALITLINDILDHAKLEAGRLTLEEIQFDVRDTTRNIVKSMAVLAADKNIDLTYDIAADVPEDLVGDPGRLRQILINLIGNAVKFTEQGGVTVTVRVDRHFDEAVSVLFSVADTGIGIPADKLGAIFEPFGQAETSTSREYGGTGLGLTIVGDLVELMQGRISVESEPDVGSTFSFTARLCVPAEAEEPKLAHASAVAGLPVLVVAEDKAADQLHAQLEEAGMEAVAAGAESPDVSMVLVDLDSGGFRLVQELKARPELAGLPTVVLTSSGQRGDAARCRELEVGAYLTRPVDGFDLRDAARALLAGTDELITRHWLRERRPELRILLADDSLTNRLVTTQMLEQRGHHVTATENGQEAVDAIATGLEFDLVLLDIEMPVMGGLEAATAIRQAGAAMPILALTGHGSQEQIAECRAAGMNGHLTKPFEYAELIEAVEEPVSA